MQTQIPQIPLGSQLKWAWAHGKKKARAKNNGAEPIRVFLSEKRTSDSVEDDTEVSGRPGKILRPTPMEVELAAAGTQPRRDQ